ncbi:DUF4260 domain-containing protein [Spirosoma oryzicola]|uniref:DUF4260 domain-containing protein n=1 Tax=Spirosoma oryzicola TaxID=2898794 RepID=UPI003134486E
MFSQLPFAWWTFPALFLLPDLSMLGYLISAKVGAFTYNLVHHKALGIALSFAGLFLGNNELMFAGILLFGHSSLDRAMGYGLKYDKGFNYTHLGEVGLQTKKNSKNMVVA